MKLVYEAGHPDLNDGFGWQTVGFFTTPDEAWEALRGMDLRVQGKGYHVGAIKSRRVYETVGEFKEQEKEEVRRRALAKLTPVERKVLGV